MNISPIGFKANPYSSQKTQKTAKQNNPSPTFGATFVALSETQGPGSLKAILKEGACLENSRT